jgi:hypothetical protein
MDKIQEAIDLLNEAVREAAGNTQAIEYLVKAIDWAKAAQAERCQHVETEMDFGFPTCKACGTVVD